MLRFSESGAADAMVTMYGKRTLPNYHLQNAKLLFSFGADFSWRFSRRV
jgi:molybdopterin-containing oxidoreductase family iron-sulfur binding subunit